MNPTLTLVNSATGEVVEDDPRAEEIMSLRAEVEELKAAIVHESRVNSNLRSQISRMKGEQLNTRDADPYANDAQRIFDFWNRILKGGKAREFGDERYKAVRARLNATPEPYTVEDFYAAIIGANELPENTPGRDNMRELEFIARNPKHMDRFIGEGRKRAAQVLGAMARPLIHRYGQRVSSFSDEMTGHVDAWYSPCPVCDSDEGLLRLRAEFQASGDVVGVRCRSGCEPKVVRARLREMVAEQRRAA